MWHPFCRPSAVSRGCVTRPPVPLCSRAGVGTWTARGMGAQGWETGRSDSRGSRRHPRSELPVCAHPAEAKPGRGHTRRPLLHLSAHAVRVAGRTLCGCVSALGRPRDAAVSAGCLPPGGSAVRPSCWWEGPLSLWNGARLRNSLSSLCRLVAGGVRLSWQNRGRTPGRPECRDLSATPPGGPAPAGGFAPLSLRAPRVRMFRERTAVIA